MHFPILQDLLIIILCSIAVVLVFQRFHLPAIIGFLVTGMLIGPFGLSLVKASEEVDMMSEIGVILLLFVIGMEISLKQLAAIRKTVILGGFVQVGLTILVSASVFWLFGLALNAAVFIGFLISLSSTAIVLKVLHDRNEMSTPQGRIALGILIFQDLIVVPMMLVTPIIAGQSDNVGMSVLILLGKSLLVIVFTIISARYLIPWLFQQVVRTRNNELFLLTTIALCFAVAFITAEAGLSLALGAFLAGLIVSESEYSHQATSIVLPFRELFTSIFFISIGMLLDLTFFGANILVILPAALLVLLVKGGIASFAAWVLKYPRRTVFITGLILFQVGEFSFILSREGMAYGLLSNEHYQYFLSISILTMAMTPFAIGNSYRITHFFARTKDGDLNPRSTDDPHDLHDHLIIIGYGVNGRNVARAAKYASIPYVIIELNPDTVKREKAKGEKILYGDAVHAHILHEMHIDKSRCVVVAISDPMATKTIVRNIRTLSSSAYLIVRTRFVTEVEEVLGLGADEVIPEELETSIEIFSRVLHKYLVPLNRLDELVTSIRSDNYKFLLPHHTNKANLPSLNIECVRIMADHGALIGRSISESDIRNSYGVNILAISRNEELISNIRSDEKLQTNDLVYISGEPQDIDEFYKAAN